MPPPGAPRVELKGVVAKVRIAMGQGMPGLEVRTAEKTVQVLLGSIRYLMEQDFRPQAGDGIEVRGYQVNGEVVAISVTTRGKTLKLRDESGAPLWMRGRRGPPGGRGQ
jgi:hypothetical protein